MKNVDNDGKYLMPCCLVPKSSRFYMNYPILLVLIQTLAWYPLRMMLNIFYRSTDSLYIAGTFKGIK